ncbi:PH domain-containing protein [Streptomyces sp. NPDC058045]|uniref:PH domain-containing protein n=1 Tax=Streptomyces sp. NPDC058045 TaxID=3346311 RepID=UPI0036E9B77D
MTTPDPKPGSTGPQQETPAQPESDSPASQQSTPAPQQPPASAGRSEAAEPKAEPKAEAGDAEPAFADRVFRSSTAIGGGVALLALVGWLGIDAVVRGEGRTPWVALAVLLCLLPLIAAFTLRPAVYVNDNRLRVRNPFRTITLPWSAVSGLRSGYTNEVFDQAGTKYQMWALPVSLRARKKAGRERVRAEQGAARPGGGTRDGRGRVAGGGQLGRGARTAQRPGVDPTRAPTDKTMDDLRELQEARAASPGAQGEPVVRWAWEFHGPVLAGLVLLIVLLATG